MKKKSETTRKPETTQEKLRFKNPTFIGLVWSLDLITRYNWFGLVIRKSEPTRPMYTPTRHMANMDSMIHIRSGGSRNLKSWVLVDKNYEKKEKKSLVMDDRSIFI